MKTRIIIACILLIATISVSLLALNVSSIPAEEAYELGERILRNSPTAEQYGITIITEDCFGKWRISGICEYEGSKYIDIVEVGKRSGRVEKCTLWKHYED